MNSYTFIFFLFFSLLSNAQSKQIVVVDALTKWPISNVLIQSEKGNLYTGLTGKVLYHREFSDSIYFSHPRYFSKSVLDTGLIDTVYLVPLPKLLNEISITAEPIIKPFDIGYYNFKKRVKNGEMINNYAIVAVFVLNTNQNVYVESIIMNLHARKYSESYNVYLFEPDSLGKPGKIIYQQHIVVDSLKEEGVINIHQLKIKVPENGVFIGLENLKIYDYGNEFNLLGKGVRYDYTDNIDTSHTYIFLQEKHLNPNGFWINHIGPNGVNRTPCFGLKVYRRDVE